MALLLIKKNEFHNCHEAFEYYILYSEDHNQINHIYLFFLLRPGGGKKYYGI